MSEVAGARPERRTEENDSWAATALCVVCESYEGAREEQRLTGAREQMAGIARRLRDLKFHVQVIGEDGDPDLATFQRKKEDWRAFWRHEGGNGPALVLWSGHGLLDGADLRLVLHDLDLTGNPSERKMRLRDQCVTTQSLVDTAMASGADQVLLVVDACHAGAGLVQSVEVALDHLERTSLPEGRAKWLGAVASCRSGELSQGYGPLVQAVSAILDHGPDGDYRAAWSVHNKQISGQDLLDAVWTRWDEDGQEPVAVTVGREERPAFPNPRSVPGAPPALVEHLVLAARGVGHREEGWFFTGRRHVLGRIVEWMGAAAPGLFLVTGPAGCGKSAVLGRIATLADPEQRERTIRQGALREGDPDPGVRKPRTFAAVHLRGMDPAQAAAELAVQLGLDEPENVDAFKAGLRRLPAPPVVVLDGLDEVPAEHTQRMVEELVFPLSRLAPVLVGSRERPFRSRLADGETLPQALARHVGDGVVIFDLEKDEPDTRKDIADYIRLRCEAAEVNGAEVVEALADRATEEDGGFLFARLVTGFLIGRLRDGATSGPELLAGLPDSVQAAFEEDLRSGPVRMRDGGATLPSAARDLLTALAWAAGRGMPAGGVWEAVASALGSESGGGGDDAGVVYDEGDVDWLLSHYGRYIVEDGEGSQAVYRLYHREFMTYLRGRPGPGGKAAEVSVLETLTNLVRRQGVVGDWGAVDPYVREWIATHAVWAGGPGIEVMRGLVGWDRESALPHLGTALHDLAVDLSRRGNREAAAEMSREAAEVYGALTDEDAAAHTPHMANALNTLAVCLAETGERQAALEPAHEAVRIRRELAQTNPAAHLPDLAMALNTLAIRLAETGDRQAALEPAHEAAHLYTQLAQTNPTAHLPNLATSLNNLANRLAETGDRQAALEPAHEAVRIRRELAQTNPAAHLPDLAMALNNLANRLAETGNRQAALEPAHEAVRIRRELA
ncbi:tetratricopeptide repeat protein, partial [Streptomyces sp. NPDC088770]|uniref:tetratricopeptide repeat protein n=1 Tax=Streptomyces sp. NPDC088770 TaxID=3365895 RepID=UPI0037FCD18A